MQDDICGNNGIISVSTTISGPPYTYEWFDAASGNPFPASGQLSVNTDTIYNVADIVTMVGWILEGTTATEDPANLCSGDIDGDGAITVADIVAIVNIILDVRAYNVDQLTPSYTDIILTKDSISLRSDGDVSGIQITLSHNSNFNFNI